MDEYIGIVKLFAGNFAPRGWAFCNGQLLSISQNTALFSILGTTYGGDGKTTFALPDLRGRCAIGTGQGPGLSNRHQGDLGGTESVTLTQAELPLHTHGLAANSTNGAVSNPSGALLANAQVTVDRGNTVNGNSYLQGSPNTTMSPQAIQPAGGSQPHENMQPYLVMNYIICLQGVFPPRD